MPSPKLFIIAIIMLVCHLSAFSQETNQGGRLSGNFQIDAQTYSQDSLIGAQEANEKILSNAFLNLIYNQGNFEVGMRYEAYKNPLLGFDSRYKGSGLAYRYISYSSDFIEVTAGDFYEQFGSGLILRAYEERQLGWDNAIDGFRFRLKPANGVQVTGLIGNSRSFWAKSTGIVRGGDVNFEVHNIIEDLLPEDILLNLGGSVVSRFEADQSSVYHLPENVLAYSARMNLSGSNFNIDGEYGYKYNDPNATNHMTYNPGTGLILSGSYFTEGIGLAVNMHRIDNMEFRTDRDSRGNNLILNFIPPLTKQHVYRLLTIFPFSTQMNGQAGMQTELTFKIPRGDWGGEYGTNVNFNFSNVNSIKKDWIDDTTYNAPFFEFGDDTYFSEYSIEIIRKLNKTFKLAINYSNLLFNKDVIENQGVKTFGMVHANVAVVELTTMFSSKHALRTELQHLWSTQDSAIVTPDNINGNWAMLFLEYTIAPSWYFTVFDEWNYGNDDPDRQLHYLSASVAYIHGNNRIGLGWGRVRGGVVCVGGVCRNVPASNGFNISVTSSF